MTSIDLEKMTDTIAQSVGVDISKDTLDVYLHPTGTARRFANTRAGRSELIAWLRLQLPGSSSSRPDPITMPSSANSPRPEHRSPKSILDKHAASPKRLAAKPKRMRSTPRCWRGSRLSLSRRCGQR
jgi:hypothetical protein